MTLTVHHAPGTATLADGLAGLLAEPLADPFAEEVVVVPTRGVERWLAQRLSHRLGVGPRGGDGVCAGVRFLTPQSLVAMLLDRERDDPWAPDRLVWPLLDTIDACLDEPWCRTLAVHLGRGVEGADADLRRARRWSVAHRLARLLASYAVQRPTLLSDWSAGSPRAQDTDGAGGPLDDDLAWQAELWRRLVPRVAGPPPQARLADTLTRLRAGGAATDGLALPGRLSLFGHTRLPSTEIELLAALGEHRDVHLWLPVASEALWRAQRDAARPGPVPRLDDDSSALVAHPLLASLGRDSRELAGALAHLPCREVPAAPGDAPTSLLGWLQEDLRSNRTPSPDDRAARVAPADDRSLQVHACHGPARQVDVLREVVTGLLGDDPSLEPRDVLVMCPDVETYAPLVAAAFGLGPGGASAGDEASAGRPAHPAHGFRVRLADRSPGSTNPLLALADRLLELSGGRVTASDVLDLASTAEIRRRFGLGDDDLERLQGWVADAGVRWGLDGSTRSAYAMTGFEHNTWRAGLDRILLGVAMSGEDHRHLGRGLPLDDVGSGEIDLAGRVAELVDRLAACVGELRSARGVGEWTTALAAGVRALGEVDAEASWQLAQLDRELARATEASSDDVDLALADVRALLATRLEARPTRANFRTGTLTVATLVPMRSVPHRVVCLLGLDDGTFPRAAVPDGDDVLARRPLTGERDARGEDRQLLLDAVLAAGETLVVTYSGADEHSGARRPPAVPVGELLDAADRVTAASVRERVLTRHPLQPHDPRNLKAGDPAHDPRSWSDHDLRGPVQRPFSFDTTSLAGARAARGTKVEPRAFVEQPLAPAPPHDVAVTDLRDAVLRPARTFLRARLDVSTPREVDDLADGIPVSLDALETWQVGDGLLREVLAGGDPEAVMTAEMLRGRLAPGRLGELALAGVVEECQALWRATTDLRAGGTRSVDVDVDLGGGRRLVGTVAGVHGTRLVSLAYSRLKPKQRLATWIDLLALTATDPDTAWTSHAVGRDPRRGPQVATVAALHDRALPWIRDLVRLRDEGLRRPLAAPVATAAAWAEAHARQLSGGFADPRRAATAQWTTNRWEDAFPKEDAEPAHRRTWGADAGLQVLLDAGLADHAWRIWEPLLTGAEQVGSL